MGQSRDATRAELLEAYQALGLRPGATAADVKRAYRNLVQMWHPDRFEGEPGQKARAEEMLKTLNWAYGAVKGAPWVPEEPAAPRPGPGPGPVPSPGPGAESSSEPAAVRPSPLRTVLRETGMVVAGYTVLFTLAGGLSFLAARIYDVLGEKPARPGNGVPAAGRVAPAPAVAPTPAAVWSVATLEQPKLRAPLEVRVEDEDEDTHTDDLENPF